MNINDYAFRDLYRSLVITKSEIMLDQFSEIMEVPSRCDSIFSYCYIDNEAGMSFECLHPAVFDTEEIVQRTNIEHGFKIRSGYYRSHESPMKIIPDGEKHLSPLFKEYIESFNQFYSSEDLEEIRAVTAWDSLREPDFPDDIKAIIYKEGMEPEQVWVRTIKPNKIFITEEKALDLLNKGFFGDSPPMLEDIAGSTYSDLRMCCILLNEPNQNFGVHMNDEVVVHPRILNDNWIALIEFEPVL